MPQLHLYVPDTTAELLRKRAEQRGLSLSKYLAEVVRREVDGGWPEGFFEDVLGAWEGELSRPPQGSYEEREDLSGGEGRQGCGFFWTPTRLSVSSRGVHGRPRG